MGRAPARGVDKESGWVERRFREIEARINGLSVGKLSVVPGSTITIQQLLTNPASPVGFWNTDATTAAADDASVTVALTYPPRAGSLHVRQNGVDLGVDEWAQSGQTVTVAPSADVIIRAADEFTTAYAYDTVAVGSAPPPILVGVTEVAGTTSSIALPAGTQAGDILILTTCGWAVGSCGDSRMTLDHTFPGQFIDLGAVYVGVEDGSGDPIAVTIGSARDATALAVYRGGTLGAGQYVSDTAPAAATGSPAMVSGRFAVTVALLRLGGATTGAISSTGSYVTDADENQDSRVCASISSWSSPTPATSPADTFSFSGSVDAWGLATYRIGV